MPLLEHSFVAFPPGVNDNADPALMPQARASQMIGLAQVSPGVGSEALRTKIAFPILGVNVVPPAGNEEGIFAYNGSVKANDKLLVIKGGNLYWTTVTANQPQAVADTLKITMADLTLVTNSTGVAPPFTAGKRVRAVQHKDEMFFVQDGGMAPVRYDGTALYKCGIVAPVTPTGGASPAGALTGAYTWYITYADSLGRESSPSLAFSATLAAQQKVINWVVSADAQVTRIYLYRTTAGPGTTLYRVVQAGFAAATVTYTDNITDTAIQVNSTIRLLQNDPPANASLIWKWKNRIILNSTTDRENIQISNLDSPTQFPLIGNTSYATDGTNMRVTNEHGDEIVAFGNLGSYLGIFHRRTIGVITGNAMGGSQPWQYLPVQSFGCIAPDSVASDGNSTICMGEDGIYSLSYAEGFVKHKLSEDLDNAFRNVAVSYGNPGVFPFTSTFTREQRAAAAIGKFMQGRYYLAAPPFVYVFDFEVKAWFLCYMTGMPYGANDAGQSGNSRGYLSMAAVQVDRQYNVLLYNPGYTPDSGVNGGYIYVGSFYPLYPDGVTDAFSFVYETRGVDGSGVARQTMKRMKESSFFGEILSVYNTSLALVSAAALTGTITADVDNGAYTETYNFGISGTFANQYARDQQEGVLIRQQWSPKVRGRVIKVRIQGTATGRLALRGSQHKYVRLDPS